MVCLSGSIAQAQRGRGGGREGGGREGGRAEGGARGEGNARSANRKPPGGNWSQRPMGGNQSEHQFGNSQNEGAKGAAAANKRNQPQASGAQGAAAGAAAENRRQPSATGAQGAAAGAAAANRNQPQYSGAEGAVAGSAAVRNNYEHNGVYGQQWYGAHATAWAPTAWAAGSAWTATSYGAVASHCGYAAAPVSYDYGNNVTCNNGNVMVNGQPAGTAEEFSQQADDLAQTGVEAQPADTDKWMPLGVFAMARDETQHPHLIMQLAINQQGILRGNYTDEVTDSVQPIHGSVDQKTQRAAWTVGENKTTVMEAGLNNLSQGEAPALIHKNGKTDRWLLVRLNQPDQNAGGAAPVSK
jgi:hypothetical protein